MKINKEISKNRLTLLCLLLIAWGIFFRIYNLSWGSPYFFHPDERNIANSVTQLSFPKQLNPNFFAYGTLPIYSIYFFGVLKNLFFSFFSQDVIISKVLFEDAMIIGRVISSFFSIILLFLIYKIIELVKDKKSAMIGIVLASLSVGYVQYTHFATFEIWLSLFTTLLLYSLIKYLLTQRQNYIFHISIICGILISIKISSLFFLPFIFLIIFLIDILKNKKGKLNSASFTKPFLKILIVLLVALSLTFFTSPFILLDNQSFLSSMRYETNVAIGNLPVFYTEGFKGTIPILYQITKVYPFILNPFILLIFLVSLPILFAKSFKTKSLLLYLVIFFFFLNFLSQAFLFVKWTRYYIPTLAFIYILLGIYISDIKNSKIQKMIIAILFFVSFIYSFSYFKSVLLDNTSHVKAATWANKNIKNNSIILSEMYDMGIVPFNSFPHITLFNFYDLETDNNEKELYDLVSTAEYIILPSQRVLKDRIEKKELFPKGYIFYSKLQNGDLGFKKVYESSCDFFCKILYFNNPIYSHETTANVFDRPQVLIYKNEKVN